MAERKDMVLVPIVGTVRKIEESGEDCCSRILSLQTPEEQADFVLSADTTVIDCVPIRTGMRIAAFFDSKAPMPLVYPPRYQAVLVTRMERGENVMLSEFDENLVSAGNTLQLNISPLTRIVTLNGQRTKCTPAQKKLLVYYSTTTRSIPPQTTPRKLVVFCGEV